MARRIALVEQQAETQERINARQPWSLVAFRTRVLCLHGLVTMMRSSIGRSGTWIWRALASACGTRFPGRAATPAYRPSIAQEPKILLLDEPTNHLDIGHQIALLYLVRKQKLTVAAALHDLNHAAMFCDRVAVLKAGRLSRWENPCHVLTPALILDVFGVQVDVELMVRMDVTSGIVRHRF